MYNLEKLKDFSRHIVDVVIETHQNIPHKEIGNIMPVCYFFYNDTATYNILPNDKELWAIAIASLKDQIEKAHKTPVVGILLLAESVMVVDMGDANQRKKALEYLSQGKSLMDDDCPLNVSDALHGTLGTAYDKKVTYTSTISAPDLNDKRKFGLVDVHEFKDEEFRGNLSSLFDFVFRKENTPVGDA